MYCCLEHSGLQRYTRDTLWFCPAKQKANSLLEYSFLSCIWKFVCGKTLEVYSSCLSYMRVFFIILEHQAVKSLLNTAFCPVVFKQVRLQSMQNVSWDCSCVALACLLWYLDKNSRCCGNRRIPDECFLCGEVCQNNLMWEVASCVDQVWFLLFHLPTRVG